MKKANKALVINEKEYMMKHTLWYVSPDGSNGQLVSASAKAPNCADSCAIQAAQPFTVSLKSVMVPASHHQTLLEKLFPQDGVLILSSHSSGNKPVVQRVHYFQECLPLDTPLDNFLADTVYVCDDYSGTERLWLEFDIVGVGMAPEERDALVSKFTTLVEGAGAIFPVILPYSFIVSNFASAVEKLLDALQQDKHLLHHRISFYPHHTRDSKQPHASSEQNRSILRQGTYVVFAEAIDGSAYTLGEDNCLTPDSNLSYIVFSIEQESDLSPDWVISQRIATLLTHLNKGNPNAEQAPIEFVTDTLRGYSNFTSLQRYQELQHKDLAERTQAEKELMISIEGIAELHAFLPKEGKA